jgi:signal transduction histidine kinase
VTPSADTASQVGRTSATALLHAWGRLKLPVQTGTVLLAVGCMNLVAEWPLWMQSSALAAANLMTTLTFVLTGLLIRREPGHRGVGWALILTGAFRPLDFVDLWNTGPWPVYGLVFGAIDRVFGAWALLRYPNPRLLRVQRRYLIWLTIWMLAGRALIAVTSTAPWNGYSAVSWWPALIPDFRLTEVISDIVNVGEALFGAALIVLLVQRLTRTSGLDRVIIAPIIVAGIAAVLAASVSAIIQLLSSFDSNANGAYLAEGIIDLAVPLAFLISVVQRALLPRNLAALIAQISKGAGLDVMQDALRVALRDPTLNVLLVPDSDRVMANSAPADLPGTANGRSPADAALTPDPAPSNRLVEFIRTEAGAPIAMVEADPALSRHRGLFDAAVSTSGLALKNAQLRAQVAEAELKQVRESRARIVEAGMAERRRLERDLHDGAQQHLLGLTAHLAAAIARTTDPEAAAAFKQAGTGIKEVLAELRDLAHGIHPAALSQGGLAAVLQALAERTPLSVRLTVPAVRTSPAVEATAYYVACEALANVVKHAHAKSVTVDIQLHDAKLDMQIEDDGIGGVDHNGYGIANIRDRVRTLDGDMKIESTKGKGTRMEVTIPCE